jgi:hypothetical protein
MRLPLMQTLTITSSPGNFRGGRVWICGLMHLHSPFWNK